MQYTFRRRTFNLPDGVDYKKTFEAQDRLSALQSASDYWFGGSRVVDWLTGQGGVTALLSDSSSANVIGTIIEL
jgi:hypothetical protein